MSILFIDDRVGSREFLRPLRRMGAPAKIHRLTYADFAFTGKGPAHSSVAVGVERKTVAEILAAVTDSRFIGRQIPGLLQTYDYVYLVVEGFTRVDARTALLMSGKWEAGFGPGRHMYEPYKKFLVTLATKARLIVERTNSFTETVHYLHALYRWWEKPWASHKSAYAVDEAKPDAAILDERTFKRRVFAQLPGVGWERSRMVSQYFPNVEAGMLADEKEWRKALKIREGRKVAGTIVRIIKQKES